MVHGPHTSVPRLCPSRAAAADGTIEVLFICAQLTLTLLVGVLREATASFAGALALMLTGFAAAAAVSWPLAALTNEFGASEHGCACGWSTAARRSRRCFGRGTDSP